MQYVLTQLFDGVRAGSNGGLAMAASVVTQNAKML